MGGLCKYAKPNVLYCFSNSTVLLIIIMKEYIAYTIPFFTSLRNTLLTEFTRETSTLLVFPVKKKAILSVIVQILIGHTFFNFVNPTINSAFKPSKSSVAMRSRSSKSWCIVSLHLDWHESTFAYKDVAASMSVLCNPVTPRLAGLIAPRYH